MKAKIITGTRANTEEQLNKFLSDINNELVSLHQSVTDKSIIVITLIYNVK